jgi:hypothetical protein
MRAAWNHTKGAFTKFWLGLRQWCGDSAYENYKRCALRAGHGTVQSPAEFYVDQLNKKYSRPNRCC